MIINIWTNTKETSSCVFGGLINATQSHPKVFVQIKFTEKGIYIYKPYKKKYFIPYTKLKTTLATYNHMGYYPTYIVFSKRTLSRYEITHINRVEHPDIIKVFKSKKAVCLIKKYMNKKI